ncbi:MAG TPA: hypothetical protein VN442_14970 [Bryobacteraceae bacterium]|nr:hypothetical protein [Bryobacteraceae bacterium]
MRRESNRNAAIRALLISVAILAGTNCLDARADWVATGPFGGVAEVIRVAPKQPNLVLAGSANGLLYQSLDGGQSWVHRYFPAQLAATLHALEADPRHRGTWYAGTESNNPRLAGVHKSEDGGATWKLLPGLTGKAIWALAVSPANPDIIAAGAADGVFLSRDAGASWARISPEANTDLRPVVSLAFHPADADVIYAGTTHLPWRTRDGGANWESIHSGMLDDSDVFSIAVDSRNPATVFASACSGVYRSGDGGGSWKRAATPPGAFRAYLVALDPGRPGVVFAATSAGLLRSMDGGVRWQRVSQHAVKSIAFDPANASKIYFASVTGGVLVSRDGGTTLADSNIGFSNRNFAAIAGSGRVLYISTVYEPANGGIFRTGDDGLHWRRMASPGVNENIVRLAAVPEDPDHVYAAGYRSLFSSTDGARTWAMQAGPPGGGHIAALLPLSRESLLVGTAAGLFRRTGGSWKAIELPGGRRSVELLQSSGGGAVTAVTAAGAFRSENGGASWAACGEPAANAVWYGLTLEPGPAGGALAATAQGLFRSTDRCASWVPVRGGLAQATVSAVVFHPQRAGEALATQFGTTFRTTDGGLTWQPLGDVGRNGAYPSALLILPGAPQRAFALFPRRGVLSAWIDPQQGNTSIGGN